MKNKVKKLLVRSLYVGSVVFLSSNSCLLGAQMGMQRFMGAHPVLLPVVSQLFHNINIAQRGYSNYQKLDRTAFPVSSDSKNQNNPVNILERYASLISQCELLLKNVKASAQSIQLKNLESTSVLEELNQNQSSTPTLSSQNSLASKKPKVLKECTINSATNPVTLVSKTINQMQEDLINNVMSMTQTSHINKQDLTLIVDLYSSLIYCAKDGITKVLNGNTNTPKSSIYNQVIAYANSKRLDLDTYRKTYAHLCDAFGEDVMKVIYRAIEKMIKEKEYLVHFFKGVSFKYRNIDDCVSLISNGSHPLYPVESSEVTAMIQLYADLKDKTRDGIARVLNKKIDTPKSSIYIAIRDYAQQKELSLDDYRHIYERLMKSLNGAGIKIIHNIVDSKMNEADVLPPSLNVPQSETSTRGNTDVYDNNAMSENQNENESFINQPLDVDDDHDLPISIKAKKKEGLIKKEWNEKIDFEKIKKPSKVNKKTAMLFEKLKNMKDPQIHKNSGKSSYHLKKLKNHKKH